jgi:hypothetical protein
MLPVCAVPSSPPAAWGIRAGRLLLRPLARLLAPVLAMVLLTVGLAGCGAVGSPPRSQLIAALELQIQLTQGAIASALALPSSGLPQISRVRVSQQEPLMIGGARGLHLSGRFDWRLPGDPYRTDTPFELYLQRGERGQSWRLARPVGSSDGGDGPGGEQQWRTDPLPIRG